MNLIAEFHCRSLLWRQTYSLFSDRITVATIHKFSGDSQATYLLSSLTPFPMRGSTRGEGLNMGVLLMFLGFGFIVWYHYVGYSDIVRAPNVFFIMAGAGLIWFLYSLRQWHYAIFSSTAGVEVISLWSPPKQVDSFGPFVEACVSGIVASSAKMTDLTNQSS